MKRTRGRHTSRLSVLVVIPDTRRLFAVHLETVLALHIYFTSTCKFMMRSLQQYDNNTGTRVAVRPHAACTGGAIVATDGKVREGYQARTPASVTQ